MNNIFTTVNEVETLIQLFIQYQPELEKDIQDILRISKQIRDKLAEIEKQ